MLGPAGLTRQASPLSSILERCWGCCIMLKEAALLAAPSDHAALTACLQRKRANAVHKQEQHMHVNV